MSSERYPAMVKAFQLFHGSHAKVIVPLDKISQYKVQAVGPTIELVVRDDLPGAAVLRQVRCRNPLGAQQAPEYVTHIVLIYDARTCSKVGAVH